MEKALIIAITGLVATIALGFVLKANAIYEDQYTLCNFDKECFDFNRDDYLSNSQIDEFELFYDNNMDTYDIDDLALGESD